MKRYGLTPEAERDLTEIRSYLTREAGAEVAKSVIRRIRAALVFLGGNPGAGHSREDLTDDPVKFWPVFSYLIVYDPATKPITVIRVIHGMRDVPMLL